MGERKPPRWFGRDYPGRVVQQPARAAIHITAPPTAVQRTKAGSEASGPNAPPVSHSGTPGTGVRLAMRALTTPPDTGAPNRWPCVKFQAA